jgi:hypothetical protein
MATDHVWLGAGQIREERNRVDLPKKVFKLGIASIDAALFWAYDTEEDAIVISRFRDEFAQKSRFETIGDSTVSGQRMVAVPRQVMNQYTGFDRSERLHFMTHSNQAEKDRCTVHPTEVAQDRFDDTFDGMFSDEK